MFCDELPSPFKRQLLERRRVIPIPIGQLSGGRKHADAFLWLFKRLAEDPAVATVNWNRPPDIVAHESKTVAAFREPWSNKDAGPKVWIETALRWRDNRKQYEGWEVLHKAAIDRLWTSTQFWLRDLNSPTAEQWTIQEKVLVLRELAWRLGRCLQPLPDRIVTDVIDPAIESFESADFGADQTVLFGHSNKKQVSVRELQSDVLAIRLELVRHAREIGDSVRFDNLCETVQENELCTGTHRSFLTHQNVLLLFAQSKYEEARALLLSWQTHGVSAIWTVRKSGLLLELGEVDAASELLIGLANELTLRRSDPSIDFGQRSMEGLTLHLLLCCKQHYETNKKAIAKGTGTHTKPRDDWSVKVVDSTKRESLVASDAEVTRAESGRSELSSELVEEGDIRQRLLELRPLGCDPQELVTWLTAVTESTPDVGNRPEKTDSFDVGRTLISFPSSNIDEFTNTYRALRFIEDAGLPLSIHGVIPINVTQKMFVNAAAHISPTVIAN